MLIDFNETEKIEIPGINNGAGTMSAKMHMDKEGKIIRCAIHKGGSIGLHKHKNGDDINYVISGKGKAICDGKEEPLYAGVCHVCKRGSEHSIVNTGDVDLDLLTIVVER